MMLVEETTVPSAALPVAEFKDHLRLGSGFADDGLQDSVLESYLRAAIAAIESRTGKILVSRSYVWTLTAWRDPVCQTLPVAPVSEISEVKLVSQNGAETVADSATYRLQKDSQAPSLRAKGTRLPQIAQGGQVEVSFVAGYGPGWTDLPPDLGQSVFLLAAHYYENRAVLAESDKPMPFGVSLLIDRYRRVRLFGEVAR